MNTTDISVEESLKNCKGIAWDECHKIYILMDDEQMELMKEYGYDPIIPATGDNYEKLLSNLIDWYDNSCGLRFIQSVRTNLIDPNEGFINLVGQFEEWFI